MLQQPNNQGASAKDKILGEYAIRLGLMLPNSAEIERTLNPTLDLINKKLASLGSSIGSDHPLLSPSKLTQITRGLLDVAGGSESLSKGMLGLGDALGGAMGLGKSWVTNTASMLNYAMMSKNVEGANRQLYESMGPLGKALVSVMSKLSGNKKMMDDINGKKSEAAQTSKPEIDRAESAMEQVSTIVTKSIEETVVKSCDSLSELSKQLDSVMAKHNSLKSDALHPAEPGAMHHSKAINNASELLPQEEMAATTSSAVKMSEAVEESSKVVTGAMSDVAISAAAASFGILLVVGAVVAIGEAFYKGLAMAIAMRMELKEFDKVMGGVGEGALRTLQVRLFGLNDGMKDLGISMEKVNESVLELFKSGVNLTRSTSLTLARTTQELSGAFGVATGEITSMFSDLIKKAKLSDDTIKSSADAFAAYNVDLGKFSSLGPISFANFKEAITSSNNALLIAQRNGDQFAKAMMGDLTTLTGMATTLGMSISEINSKFEEAGSLINSASSGFRDLLVVSGGAGINNLMTDQFSKTDAMMKMAAYLKDLNQQFGNNINITAEVASKTWGLSKEQSLQLLNMSDQQMRHVREMKELTTALNGDEVHKAYEKVTSTVTDTWEKVKATFSNMMERVMGGSGGMYHLSQALDGLLKKLMAFLNSDSMQTVTSWINTAFDKAGSWLSSIIDDITGLISKFQTSEQGFWSTLGSVLMTVCRPVFDLLADTLGSAFDTICDIFIGKLKDALPLGSGHEQEARDRHTKFTPEQQALMDQATALRAQKSWGVEDIGTQSLKYGTYGMMVGAAAGAPTAGTLSGPAALAGGAIGAIGGAVSALLAAYQHNGDLEQQALDLEKKAREPGSKRENAIIAATAIGRVISEHISRLEREISQDKAQQDAFKSAGAKDMDLTYGKDVHGNARFLTVAERQYALQEEIKAKEEAKAAEEKVSKAIDRQIASDSLVQLKNLNSTKNGQSQQTNTAVSNPPPQPILQHNPSNYVGGYNA